MTSKEDLKTLLEYFYYQGKTPIIPKEQAEFILNNIEKDLELLEKYKKVETLLKQKEAVIRYFEAEDCFGVKTISSDWHKLTDDFLNKNIKEGLKPNPAIQRCKELKEELAKYKALEEELGCPLEVRDRALMQEKIYYEENGKLFEVIVMTCGWIRYYKTKICTFNCIYDNPYTTKCLQIKTSDYKKTWWLKKDKSE